MNRKGFVFTMLAIMITSIIVVFFLIGLESVDYGQSSMRDSKMLTMLMEDIEDDVSRGLYITSFRTLMGQIERTIVTGNYLSSAQDTFVEGMINGTIEGSSPEILEDTSFMDWLEKITLLIEERGYTFDYEITRLTQTHTSPWSVTATLMMEYNITSPDGMKGYNRIIDIQREVPIIGLEDPAYYIQSLGRLSNTINKSDTNDIMLLIDASSENSRYIESNLSHSFLQRLEGDFSPSNYGIESIVSGQRFKSQGIIDYEGRSSIDALYFIDSGAIVQCVEDAPEWFRIDINRISRYDNINNITC